MFNLCDVGEIDDAIYVPNPNNDRFMKYTKEFSTLIFLLFPFKIDMKNIPQVVIIATDMPSSIWLPVGSVGYAWYKSSALGITVVPNIVVTILAAIKNMIDVVLKTGGLSSNVSLTQVYLVE